MYVCECVCVCVRVRIYVRVFRCVLVCCMCTVGLRHAWNRGSSHDGGSHADREGNSSASQIIIRAARIIVGNIRKRLMFKNAACAIVRVDDCEDGGDELIDNLVRVRRGRRMRKGVEEVVGVQVDGHVQAWNLLKQELKTWQLRVLEEFQFSQQELEHSIECQNRIVTRYSKQMSLVVRCGQVCVHACICV